MAVVGKERPNSLQGLNLKLDHAAQILLAVRIGGGRSIIGFRAIPIENIIGAGEGMSQVVPQAFLCQDESATG